jgi:hypothetical protein
MAEMNWSRRFEDPIELPDGRIINTIGEAAEYALELPSKIGSTPPWQRAADALHKAAEHGGPFVFMARISFYLAIHGDAPPPIGNPRPTKADRFKAKREALKRKKRRDRRLRQSGSTIEQVLSSRSAVCHCDL